MDVAPVRFDVREEFVPYLPIGILVVRLVTTIEDGISLVVVLVDSRLNRFLRRSALETKRLDRLLGQSGGLDTSNSVQSVHDVGDVLGRIQEELVESAVVHLTFHSLNNEHRTLGFRESVLVQQKVVNRQDDGIRPILTFHRDQLFHRLTAVSLEEWQRIHGHLR